MHPPGACSPDAGNCSVVPEAGLEPACLAARDFHTTSAFAAAPGDRGVRGLEHAFTIAMRLQVPAVCSLHLPRRVGGAWLGVGADAAAPRAFAEFDGFHSAGFPAEAQILKSLVSTSFTTRAVPG